MYPINTKIIINAYTLTLKYMLFYLQNYKKKNRTLLVMVCTMN